MVVCSECSLLLHFHGHSLCILHLAKVSAWLQWPGSGSPSCLCFVCTAARPLVVLGDKPFRLRCAAKCDRAVLDAGRDEAP